MLTCTRGSRGPSTPMFSVADVAEETRMFGGNGDAVAVIAAACGPDPLFVRCSVAVADLATRLLDTDPAWVLRLVRGRRDGQRWLPIVVGGGLVVDGNHRAAAAMLLGEPVVDAFVHYPGDAGPRPVSPPTG